VRWELPDANNHGRSKHCYVVHWNGNFRLNLWRYRLIITMGTKCTEIMLGKLFCVIPVSMGFLILVEVQDEEEINAQTFRNFLYS
jgi:hypothetical protein